MSRSFPIIVDWGTSNFRAYRFGESGLAEERRAEAGIMKVAGGDFEGALRAAIGDWLAPGAEILLSGMITSRNGWVETPYVFAPASLADLKRGVVSRTLAEGATLRFLPGVAQKPPRADVMRGEEIQCFGAVRDGREAMAVLPGTHSKWARMEDDRITGFASMMTGEMFAVLKDHSILGRLMPPPSGFRAEAFARGVALALDNPPGGFLNHIFTARSAALLGALPAEDIADYLSGILIGHEAREGLRLAPGLREVVLIGEGALAERYAAALAIAGVKAILGDPRATIAGFERLALSE